MDDPERQDESADIGSERRVTQNGNGSGLFLIKNESLIGVAAIRRNQQEEQLQYSRQLNNESVHEDKKLS